MDGFKRRPKVQPGVQKTPQTPGEVHTQQLPPQPEHALPQLPELSIDSVSDDKGPALHPPKRRMPRRIWGVVLMAVVALIVMIAIAGAIWYKLQSAPVDPSDQTDQKVEVKKGATLAYVAERLQERGIIRDQFAFQVRAYLTGKAGQLKEGTCIVHKSQSSAVILDTLAKGCHDFVSVTFYPGATIEKPLYKPPSAQIEQTMYVKYILNKLGYSDSLVTQALQKQYSSPLFEGKPAGTSLEGYIYGETYYIPNNATAEQLLQTTFDQMYSDISNAGLLPKYQAEGFTLYQAITMASIVQRELNCEGKPTPERKDKCYQYQRTIAQVFLKRYKEGVSLGSDVTFIYAADMMGVAPSVDLDSPYNTRIHAGLPPGPIGTPGLLALKAVADPTATDYNFFIAGDDGLIYFARTAAEHEANIAKYCQKLCNEL